MNATKGEGGDTERREKENKREKYDLNVHGVVYHEYVEGHNTNFHCHENKKIS
jgi:hypothetical protein